MLCTIHYTSSFRNTKQQKQCSFSKELAICILHSELGTGNVKGNMMIMRMRVVTDLINYRNYSLALLHCCLYIASLELLGPGKRWVCVTRAAEVAIKRGLALPFPGFCTFLFPFSLLVSLFLQLTSTYSSFLIPQTQNCMLFGDWRRGGGNNYCSVFHPDLKSWVIVGSDVTAMYLF